MLNIYNKDKKTSTHTHVFTVHNATLTDVNQCKVTQSGIEYQGPIAMTAGGIRCQSWFGKNQLHQV